MKIKKRILSLALVGTMALGLMPGMTMTASATEPESTTSYTITIPSTLTVANTGWNATSGISATGTLDTGKKLTVMAASGDEFALVNQSDNTQKVGYKLATASTDTEATTSWTFDSLNSTATKKDMGIIVEDYSTKPAGTYTDTVTFTAKVEKGVRSVKWDDMNSMHMSVFDGSDSKTLNGITATATSADDPIAFGDYINMHGSGYFTFSSSEGKISKIVITHTQFGSWMGANAGWPQFYDANEGGTFTWSGAPAESVTLSSDGHGSIHGVTSIEFTIE